MNWGAIATSVPDVAGTVGQHVFAQAVAFFCAAFSSLNLWC
jgi:hypothetical protein